MTNETECGKIVKLLERAPSESKGRLKKVEKKCLTNEAECGKIVKLLERASQAKARALKKVEKST